MNEGAQRFVKHMLAYTVRLVRNAASFPTDAGIASGFLLEREDHFLLLTAGHIFDRPGSWTLETNVSDSHTTLHVAVRDVQLIAGVNFNTGHVHRIDVAWARIAQSDVCAGLAANPKLSGRRVELPIYRGPLDSLPNRESYYGFAAWNRVEFHEDVSTLVSEPSFEIGLCFLGENSQGLYEFELARPHQGREYYEGASGAPIADEEGRIVGLLLCGDIDRNVLFAAPLACYAPYLAVGT